MEEAELNSVNEEFATQEADPETHSDDVVQEPQGRSGQIDQERNWKAARQRIAELEKLAREKDELLKQSLAYQQSIQKQEEPEEVIDEEEYANYGGVKKLASKTVEPLKKELEELKAQLAQKKQMELLQSLRSRYSDFDDVVNPETIALFEEKEPELANQIAEIADPYKIGMQSYKFIKASGLLDEVPNKRRRTEAKQKLEKNESTVQSPQAYDKRPMAQAFKMTKAEQSKLYEEMMHFSSQVSSVPQM